MPTALNAPDLIVVKRRQFHEELPGLLPVVGAERASGIYEAPLLALGIDFSGLAPRVARRSLLWLHEQLAGGDAFRLHESEQETELIIDRRRIGDIVSAMVATEARGRVMSAASCLVPGPARVAPARVTSDGQLLIGKTGQCRTLRGPFDVELEGYHSVYEFRWADPTCLTLPDTMVRVRRRRHRRIAAPWRLRASFAHALWNELTVDAAVHDLSAEGISIETDAVRDVLYPGLPLRGLELRWKGGACLRCDAVIAHVTQLPHSAHHRIGIRLLMSASEAGAWQNAVDELLHPRVRASGHSAGAFWEMYTVSRYFNMSGKDEAFFAADRRAFVRSQELLEQAPAVGAAFAHHSEQRIEAVAHQISPWPSSWVFYQFCRRPEGRPLAAADDKPLLDLYARAYEYVQRQPGARWLVTYVQTVARFSRLVYHNFAERYTSSGRTHISEFRALEVDTRVASPPGARFSVGAAQSDDLVILAAKIHSSRAALYSDATGLQATDMELQDTVVEWESSGLLRRRHVLVARRRGRAVAAAVLDAVDDGLHLFGLLDVVRLFSLKEHGDQAFGCLLEEARRLFCALGKRRFAYFAHDSEDPQATERTGCTDLGTAFMIVIPVELLPELVEHVSVLTAPRGAIKSLAGE